MSHKTKKLTWYSLFLRIGKMTLKDTKENLVQVRIGEKLYPAELEYSQSGEVVNLKLQDENITGVVICKNQPKQESEAS